MIVKLNPEITRFINREDARQAFIKCKNEWIRCVPPFGRSTVYVIIGGLKTEIKSSWIIDVINEERGNYKYCSCCGSVQKIAINSCKVCNGNKFESIIDAMTTDSYISNIIKRVYGI